jgi:hypothetical protein
MIYEMVYKNGVKSVYNLLLVKRVEIIGYKIYLYYVNHSITGSFLFFGGDNEKYDTLEFDDTDTAVKNYEIIKELYKNQLK